MPDSVFELTQAEARQLQLRLEDVLESLKPTEDRNGMHLSKDEAARLNKALVLLASPEPTEIETVEIKIGVALCACSAVWVARHDGDSDERADHRRWCKGAECTAVTYATVRAQIPKPQPRKVHEVEGEVVT